MGGSLEEKNSYRLLGTGRSSVLDGAHGGRDTPEFIAFVCLKLEAVVARLWHRLHNLPIEHKHVFTPNLVDIEYGNGTVFLFLEHMIQLIVDVRYEAPRRDRLIAEAALTYDVDTLAGHAHLVAHFKRLANGAWKIASLNACLYI